MTHLGIISANTGVVTLNYQEVSHTMADLFSVLEEQNADVGLAVAAFALATAKMLSPTELSVEEEIKFIQASMEWSGTYFASGASN